MLWKKRSPLLLLFVCVAVSPPAAAAASMLHSSVADDPAKFAGTLVTLGGISPLFSLCLDQLSKSGGFESYACQYSFDRMNYIARSFNILPMREGDQETFMKVLHATKELSEEQRK